MTMDQEEIDYLKRADETLGAAITRIGRVERVIIPDMFAALIHAIVGQLISIKAAHTIWIRMQELRRVIFSWMSCKTCQNQRLLKN